MTNLSVGVALLQEVDDDEGVFSGMSSDSKVSRNKSVFKENFCSERRLALEFYFCSLSK